MTWKLKMNPVEYLKQHPEGPHAATARGILAGQLVKPEKVKPEEAAFRISSWAGMPNYECKICPFATLDKAQMQEHLALGQHIGGKYAGRLA